MQATKHFRRSSRFYAIDKLEAAGKELKALEAYYVDKSSPLPQDPSNPVG
jgi:hypothetical protein